MAGLSHCMDVLRQNDRERYIACLYLPAALREDVAAIWAFDAEIAKIPSLVSEPMPGEIRMQWWRDVIRSGEVSGNAPVATALINTIRKHDLPRENFHTFLEAKTFDLYQDPMPDMNSLEGYLGETHSMMFHFATLCADKEREGPLADACGHAGVAFGLTRILADTARHRHRQQMYVPLPIARQFGLDRDGWLFETPDERHISVVAKMTEHAREHLDQAASAIRELPASQQTVFRNLAIVGPILHRIDRAGTKLFEERVTLSPISRFWHLFRAKYQR